MQELLIGLGLFLVIEGLFHAAFPGAVKRVAAQLPELSDNTLRIFGVIAMLIGVTVVWLVKL